MIIHPITSLQKNNVKFSWFEKCETSFHQLKKLFTSAPILKIENLEKDFVVCTDACVKGMGGVLMQE